MRDWRTGIAWAGVWCFLVATTPGCESNCGDGVDDDSDGLVDCEDRECFGDPDFCSTERSCTDRQDNDLDDLVDCEDPDCSDVAGIVEVDCTDGYDDDCDGDIDCADSDCASVYYCSYESYCDNGIDDDHDGDIDCADPDCVGAYNCSEYPCDDSYDNDRDGLTDCADPDCVYDPRCSEYGNCSDYFDNDGDGMTDCADPDCTYDYFCDESVNCYDGWDNDLDGFIDCQDSDCAEEYWCEREAPDCIDGVDNDGDGLTDCADPDCAEEWDCDEGWHCDDAVDNDHDGLTDCADPDCAWSANCDESANCFDGADNDGDGLIDCADPDCAEIEACAGVGYWEQFEEGETPDVVGYTISFVPDETDENGYRFTVSHDLEGLVEPGTGEAVAILGLENDDFEEHLLSVMPEVVFFGISYSSIFVGSNGYVTFGRGSTSRSVSAAAHFTFPSVAAFRSDLNPGVRGQVTVDETPELVAVTFEDVIAVGNTSPTTFQVLCHADGEIDLLYTSLAPVDGIVGISSGGGSFPPETDFVP